MIRSQTKTYRGQPVPNGSFNNQITPDDTPFQADNFLKGLILDADPKMIPMDSFQNCLNMEFVQNRLFRRNGLQSYGLAKPDSKPIIGIYAFYSPAIGVTFLRFTATSIYKATASGWVAITGAGLNSTTNDLRAYLTVADGRAFFTIGGADVIQEIDPVANTYAALGNAPKYKYISSAFNRIIGANLRGGIADIPYQIGWSGDLNYGQWDPTVDISAGLTPLVDTPADESDDITGVFQVQSAICIPRQKSIWLGTNLPAATNPFYFFTALPRIGADCPQTTRLTRNGLTFYNFQQAALYYFKPNPNGSQDAVELSIPIKRSLKSVIVNPDALFASYDYDTDTYSLFYTNTSNLTTYCYSYNFTLQNWSYKEFQSVTFVGDLDFASSSSPINGLSGTINALQGIINQLGGLVANSNRFFGFVNGDISTKPTFAGTKADITDITLDDSGSSFTSTVDSKTFSNPSSDSYFNTTYVEYTPYTTGSVSLYYSKDNGNTWKLYKTKTVTTQMLFSTQKIVGRKPTKTTDFIWRFQTSDCMASVNNFKVWAEASGISL